MNLIQNFCLKNFHNPRLTSGVHVQTNVTVRSYYSYHQRCQQKGMCCYKGKVLSVKANMVKDKLALER